MKHNTHRTFFSCLILLAIGSCFFGLGASRAEAQVLVYRLDFKKTDRSINFDFFDAGYFVVGGLGGEGSIVVTYRENGRDFYLQSDGAGELFFAVKPGAERAVIRASAENGTAQSQYLLIGDLDDRISVNLRGQHVTLAVSSFLRGSALASDSEADVEFLSSNSIGFAGFADIKAYLDRTRTRNANKANQDVSGAVADLIEDLERTGISDGSAEDEDGDTDDGDDTGDEDI